MHLKSSRQSKRTASETHAVLVPVCSSWRSSVTVFLQFILVWPNHFCALKIRKEETQGLKDPSTLAADNLVMKPRTKVITCAARVMCAKELLIGRYYIYHIIANVGFCF